MKSKSRLTFPMLIILILVFLMSGCTSKTIETATNKNDLSLSVSYGYDKCVKYGRYMNIEATITNLGKEFVGEFQTLMPTDDNNHVMYEKEVMVPAGQTMQVTLTVPVNTSYHLIEFNLVDSNGTTIQTQESKMDIIGGIERIMIGVITDDEKSVNYLSNNNTKVFFLEKENLPEAPLAYDTLDALVINNFDTSLLSEEQYQAIKGFVTNGGTLVVGTGEHADRTLRRINPDMIKLEVGDATTVEKLFGTDTTKQVITTTVEDGKELASSKDIPLVWQVDVGKGKVQIIGFDMGLEANAWNTIGTQLLGNITDNFSKTMIERMQYEYRGYVNSYGIFNSLGVADTKNLPKVGVYTAIIVIYLVLIGPLLYFILKKKDKRNYTWTIIHVLSILFTLLIFGIGSKTRMSEPYVGYLSIINVNQDMTATDNTFFSLTAPYNTNYGISLDDKYQVNILTNNSGYYNAQEEDKLKLDQYKTAIHYNDSSTEVSLRNYAAFQSAYFTSNASINIEGTYQSDLQYSDFKLNGSFTNQLGVDLSHAAVFTNNTLVNVGEIPNQETVTLDKKEQVTLTSRDAISNSDILTNIAGGNAYLWNTESEASRRYYALEYYISNHFDYLENSSYLIGFDYSEDNKDVISELGLKNSGVRLIVIPLDVNTTKDGKTYLSHINGYMNIEAGEYDSTYNMIMTNQLKVVYQFNPDDKIVSLLYSKELNTEFLKDYWSGFYGTISAYNYNTKEYDLIFTGGTPGECNNLANYINEDNIMSLLFVIDKTAQNKYAIVLPTISAIKEAK